MAIHATVRLLKKIQCTKETRQLLLNNQFVWIARMRSSYISIDLRHIAVPTHIRLHFAGPDPVIYCYVGYCKSQCRYGVPDVLAAAMLEISTLSPASRFKKPNQTWLPGAP